MGHRKQDYFFPLQAPISDSEDDTDNDQVASLLEEWDDSEHSNLLKLLCAISDDQIAQRLVITASSAPGSKQLCSVEGYVHRESFLCNRSLDSNILRRDHLQQVRDGTDPRHTLQMCNCIDFDICEMCEAKNSHINAHVFLKFRFLFHRCPILAMPCYCHFTQERTTIRLNLLKASSGNCSK